MAEFLAVRNILRPRRCSRRTAPARALRTEGGLVLRSSDGGFVAGERVWVGVRPERMRLGRARARTACAGVLEDGSTWATAREWRVRAGGDVLTVAERGDARTAAGPATR